MLWDLGEGELASDSIDHLDVGVNGDAIQCAGGGIGANRIAEDPATHAYSMPKPSWLNPKPFATALEPSRLRTACDRAESAGMAKRAG